MLHTVRARMALVVAVMVGFIVLAPMPAYAVAASDGDLIVPFDLSWIIILRLLAIPVLLPAAVGFVNRALNWPPFAKRLSLAVLAMASSIGTEFLSARDAGTPYDIWNALLLGVVAYLVAEFTYQKFYTISLARPGEPKAPTLATRIAGSPAPAADDKTVG